MTTTSFDDEFAKFEAEMKVIDTVNQKIKTVDKEKTSSIKKSSSVISAKPQIHISLDSSRNPGNELPDIPAALSGFPIGTPAQVAATQLPYGQQPHTSSTTSFPRVDMTTGRPLTSEEQQMIASQQSVYEYDPSKQGKFTPGGKRKRVIRAAGGAIWDDPTLLDWPENDFRLFCGDLGNEVTDELLAHAFSSYPSFQRSKVVRDKASHKTKGFGFVSFSDPFDCAKALREMNGKYIGNRPVKLSKSKWQERNIDQARKKMKRKNKSKHLFG